MFDNLTVKEFNLLKDAIENDSFEIEEIESAFNQVDVYYSIEELIEEKYSIADLIEELNNTYIETNTNSSLLMQFLNQDVSIYVAEIADDDNVYYFYMI